MTPGWLLHVDVSAISLITTIPDLKSLVVLILSGSEQPSLTHSGKFRHMVKSANLNLVKKSILKECIPLPNPLATGSTRLKTTLLTFTGLAITGTRIMYWYWRCFRSPCLLYTSPSPRD